jgi:hypothetical protein
MIRKKLVENTAKIITLKYYEYSRKPLVENKEIDLYLMKQYKMLLRII